MFPTCCSFTETRPLQRSGSGRLVRALHLIALLVLMPVFWSHGEPTREESRFIEVGRKKMEDRLYEQAESDLRALLAQFPQSEFREEAMWLLARCLFKQGRLVESIELLETQRAVTGDAWQDDYLALLGEAQLKSGRGDAALKTYETLLTRFPLSNLAPHARYGMARAWLQQGNFESAEAILRVLQDDPNPGLASQARLALGASLILQKKFDPAFELLTLIAREEKDGSTRLEALFALGEMEMERERYATARPHFESVAKNDRPEAQHLLPMALFHLGRIEEVAQNWTAAAKHYENAFRKGDDPSHQLKCVDRLTGIHLKLGKPEVLAEMLKQWADDHEQTRLGEALLLEIGIVWRRAGQGDQAIVAFQQFFKKYPAGHLTDRAHFNFGWVFLDDKKYESAASEFVQAAEAAVQSRNPDLQADAWLKVGDLQLDQQKSAEAAEAYARAAQVKGADPAKTEQGLYQAALANSRAGKATDVLALQAIHTTQYPGGKYATEFLLLVADAHRRLGDMTRVAETYKIILDRNPESPHAAETWLGHAQALFSVDKFKDAYERFSLFQERYPKHELTPRALLGRAQCLDRMDQTDKALRELESLVQNHPKTSAAAEAQFWLGAHFDQNKRYDLAQEKFEILCRNFPDHPLAPEATYFAARAAFRLGQKDEDIGRLLRALNDRYPNSPWIFDGRLLDADLQTRKGRFQEALLIFDDLARAYEKASTLELATRMLDVHGRRGECLRQLKRYNDAIAAFKIIVESPKADAALRNQACVELGKTYENAQNLIEAVGWYLKPLYEPAPAGAARQERDSYWVCKGALAAVGIYETQKNREAAAGILKRIISSNLACRKDAEDWLKKLQPEHAAAR